jgi:hypothetical protein
VNGTAVAKLYNRPHIRRGVDYGFDADEAARIRAEFPSVEIVFDIDRAQMQAFAIGEYGADPVRVVGNIQPWQQPHVASILRECQYEASNWRNGKYDKQIRSELEREEKAEVRAITESLDPQRMATEALTATGNRVAPVSMAGAA